LFYFLFELINYNTKRKLHLPDNGFVEKAEGRGQKGRGAREVKSHSFKSHSFKRKGLGKREGRSKVIHLAPLCPSAPLPLCSSAPLPLCSSAPHRRKQLL